MKTIGQEILEDLGEDAIYMAPFDGAEPVAVRAIVRDRGAKARVGRGLVLTSDAVATVTDHLSFARGGKILISGAEYRIDGKQVGAPGLMELELVRLDGEKVERRDGFDVDVIEEFGEPITINGAVVLAHIVRTGVEREIRQGGNRGAVPGPVVETIRTIATVRMSDVPGIRPKDEVVIAGRVHAVRSTDRDGYGLISLTLD